jgi:regulator of ribonuclease activity A
MRIATTDISDHFGDEARVLSSNLRDFGGRDRFHGSAVTIKCFEDNSRIKESLATPGRGKVLVVDGGASTRCALLGDIIAQDAVTCGWEGIIVSGCVRDSAVLKTLDIGIKALGAMPRKSTRRGEGTRGISIVIDGMRVNAGDIVVGDEDGVVILTAEQGHDLLNKRA